MSNRTEMDALIEAELSRRAKEWGARGGRARAAKLSPEKLSAIGKKAVAAREQKRRATRLGAAKVLKTKVLTK